MALSRQALLSTAELIKCTEVGATDISTEQKLSGFWIHYAIIMYQSRPQLCQSVRDSVAEVYGESFHVFRRPIEYSIKVAECPAAGQNIFEYAPKNAAAESYRCLAEEALNPPRQIVPSCLDKSPTLC